jgi:hypothetical protein
MNRNISRANLEHIVERMFHQYAPFYVTLCSCLLTISVRFVISVVQIFWHRMAQKNLCAAAISAGGLYCRKKLYASAKSLRRRQSVSPGGSKVTCRAKN